MRKQKHEEIATQMAELHSEELLDDIVSEEATPAAAQPTQPVRRPPAKKPKKHVAAPAVNARYAGVSFSAENACVFKWQQISVGTTYKAMSVGTTPRARTGIVLVPVTCEH